MEEAMSKKLFWLCPHCGEILEKSAETAQVVRLLGVVKGVGTCPGCGVSQLTSSIYAGDFDFLLNDEELRVILTQERQHLSYDADAKRWSHRGMRLQMLADRSVSRPADYSGLNFYPGKETTRPAGEIDIEEGRGIAPSRMGARRAAQPSRWRGALSFLIVIGMYVAAWKMFTSSVGERHTGVFAEGESGVLIEHVESGVGVILMPTLPELARLCRRFSGERHELILEEVQSLETWSGLDPNLGLLAKAGRASYAQSAHRTLWRALLAVGLVVGAAAYFMLARKLSRRPLDADAK
jgi:hypothetical protein